MSAPPADVREIPFEDLSRRLRIKERRIPVLGMLETTFRCNLACAHCYVNRPPDDDWSRAREMSFARIESLIDEITAAGCLTLVITGGEPLLRPDFPKLYVHAVRQGLLVTVFTNGTLVDRGIVELFDRHRPEAVEITLYGMTAETYERVTRVPGSHARCIAGIQSLVDRGIRVRLKAMALKWNRSEIGAMRDYATRLGIEFRHDGQLNPRFDGRPSRALELQLAPQDVVDLEMADDKGAAALRRFCDNYVPGRAEVGESERVLLCGAGETSFAVDPTGRLLPCLLLRRMYADLGQGTFSQCWSELSSRLRALTCRKPSPCRKCNLAPLCGSCSGAAEIETGDLEGIVPRFCRIAHLRAHALMGDSCGHSRDASCCLAPDRPVRKD
ncbi:MAG: radical SAM protein [Vicinamibacteria bacterium]|nr:radical SAM protein [Vicinamibacteria bacterium]